MGETSIKKANEFLQFVADNELELKRAIKKNITNDTELFDDCFQETIIKVYNSIIKNDTEIKDYKQYFFISAKWTFLYRQNKKRKEEAQTIRDYFDNGDVELFDDSINEETRYNEILKALINIKEIIIEKFGDFFAEVFFDYFRLKITTKMSYKKIAAEKGVSVRRVAEIISIVKDYIATSEEIRKYKTILTD